MPSGRLHALALLSMACAICAAPALRADATIRYRTTTRRVPGLPSAFDGSLQSMERVQPPEMVLRLKGSMVVGGSGGQTFIFNFEKQEATVINLALKTVATLPFSDFAALLAPKLSISPWAISGMKPKIDSRMTGRTDTIQGVQTDEREIAMSWEITQFPQVPEGARSMTWRWRIWSAAQTEQFRVPAIGEFTNLWSRKQGLETVLGNIFGKLSGLDPTAMEAFAQPPVALRIHGEFHAPVVILAARKMAEQSGQTPPAADPDAAVFEVDQVVTELSDAPVDPSLFELPKDYKVLSAESVREASQRLARNLPMDPSIRTVPGGVPGGTAGGVIGGIIGSVPTTAPAPLPPPPPGGTAAVTPHRIRISGDVQQAKLVRQPKPVYPLLALQAHVAGEVKFDAVIAKDGTVQNLTVVSGHPVLVPAALESVKQWVYQPTFVNGEAVGVDTQIVVNFTLSDSTAAGVPAEPAPNQIVSRISGKCLDVRGASTAGGAALQQFACDGGVNQQWDTRTTGEIVSRKNGKCLDAQGSRTVDRPFAQQLTCHGGDGQQWDFRTTGEIVSRNSGKCLDVEGGSSADGAAVILFACQGRDNQKWTVVKSGAPGSMFRVGGSVTAPVALQRVQPQYTEAARKAKLQGTVVIYVEVDTSGHARNTRVLRGLGLGLDEEAIKAVQQWEFRPGYKDGKAVTVAATIQVNFALLN